MASTMPNKQARRPRPAASLSLIHIYFVCSDEWFDNFVYEVAIRQDRLSPEMQKTLDSDPIGWPFWNTFNPGSA